MKNNKNSAAYILMLIIALYYLLFIKIPKYAEIYEVAWSILESSLVIYLFFTAKPDVDSKIIRIFLRITLVMWMIMLLAYPYRFFTEVDMVIQTAKYLLVALFPVIIIYTIYYKTQKKKRRNEKNS